MPASKTVADPAQRLNVLRRLLSEGEISTQEELVQELRSQKFVVTQSTISRDLRRLGAIKARDASRRIVYRLPEEFESAPAPMPTNGFKGLLTAVEDNGSLIVIHTTPGSASLVARQLDQMKSEGILGTIAGDDTIFVAPVSTRKIQELVERINAEFF
jgi:transcriptional regulator of arginine metabolism